MSFQQRGQKGRWGEQTSKPRGTWRPHPKTTGAAADCAGARSPWARWAAVRGDWLDAEAPPLITSAARSAGQSAGSGRSGAVGAGVLPGVRPALRLAGNGAP